MTVAKQPAIPCAAGALVARVAGCAAGRPPARERAVKLPPPVKPIPAQQIRAIRLGLGGTQTEFATLLNVPAVTAISWEYGTRKRSGPALRLLAVARHHPEALHAASRCGTMILTASISAATALLHRLPLVTRNEADFTRVARSEGGIILASVTFRTVPAFAQRDS